MTLAPSQIWAHAGRHHLEALANPWYVMLARLHGHVADLTVDFWRAKTAQTLFLPITTGSISSPMGLGSDSTPVAVELAGVRTYLADSMQFMLEFGCRLTGRACYYVMPSFRGDPIDATHLSQFFHSEAEIPGGLDEVQIVVEEYIRHLTAGLLVREADALRAAGRELRDLEDVAERKPFEQISFSEALPLAGEGGVVQHQGWRSLTRTGELALIDKVGQFTWVAEWDHLAVPFYQAFADAGRATARNADLLFGLGEVVGAGERHTTPGQVTEALTLHCVDQEPYRWYSEMREARPMRTAGFGMGVERFLAWLVGHHDIRDLQLVPRENGRDIVP